MKRLILIPILSIFWTGISAQTPDGNAINPQKMTLNQCMIYAIDHNTGVKKQEQTNENYRQDMLNAGANLLPRIEGSVEITNKYGRGVDPETNTYIKTETFNNYYSLSTSMPIFTGLANINTYRIGKIWQKIGVEQLQQQKDNTALNTMQAFLNVVYYMASVDITKKQLETSTQTLKQSKKMLELGLKSAADVAQIESQVASNDLSLTQQQNSLDLAILKLKEQMNYPIDETLSLDTCLNLKQRLTTNLGDALEFSLQNNPKILQSNYNVNKAQLTYKVALGSILPSISIYAGYNTNYFKNMASSSNHSNFSDQFKDNKGTYIGASLNIPIFYNLDKKTQLNKARNNRRIASYENEEAKRALQTEITQTALEMEGFKKENIQATKKVNAAELAHKANLQKFEKGLLSPIELQTSADELLLAKSQQLNAKLQHFIKSKMMKYYEGNGLISE